MIGIGLIIGYTIGFFMGFAVCTVALSLCAMAAKSDREAEEATHG
jgi:hypothetical protein